MFEKLRIKYFKKDKTFFEEIASSKNAAGYFNLLEKLPNPDKILRSCGGGFNTLRDLKNNYQVGTCIESRKAGVTSKNWRLEKQNCSDKEFEFYTELFKIIDVHQFIEDILEAPLFGYAPLEVTYEKDGNYIVSTKITSKPQEWFYFNAKENNEFYFNSKNNDGGILIDSADPRFLLPRHRATYLNPYGEALLSRTFWNTVFINGGMEFWSVFMEQYGMPFMVGKYDRGTPKEEKEELFSMLKKMVQNAVGVIPKDGSIEIINPDKSGSNTVYKDYITKCENNISKIILGQTLTTDIGSTGSYAASETHQEVRGDLIQNDVRLCEKTINNFIFKIHNLNFNNLDMPHFTIYDDEGVDQTTAERDNKVKTLGVNFTREYIKKTYGLEDADFVLDSEISKNDKEEINFSDMADDDFTKLENLLENISPEDYETLINDSLKPVITLFKQSRDADECMEKLAEIYPEMNTEKLEDTLTKVIFLAELMGRINE